MTYPSIGSHFSEEFIQHLKTKKTKSYLLTIDNIRIRSSGDRTYKFPSLALYFEKERIGTDSYRYEEWRVASKK